MNLIMQKTLDPEAVLKAVAHFIRTEFPEDFDATITCKFIDDDGTVEVIIVEKSALPMLTN